MAINGRENKTLVAQLVAVVVFLTLMTSFDDAEVELDDDDGSYDYDE